MPDTTPDCQTIEDAYEAPARVIEALPESDEQHAARYHLELSREHAFYAREQARDADPGEGAP